MIVGILALLGCDSEKIAKLEKQNQGLQDQLKKQQVTANLDLQAKCARDAKAWFKENWVADKTTVLLDYTNHYNQKMNKCFIEVEHHYKLDVAEMSWFNNMTLWDVYENAKYADFSEAHEIYKFNNYKPNDHVYVCNEPGGTKCSTGDDFWQITLFVHE